MLIYFDVEPIPICLGHCPRPVGRGRGGIDSFAAMPIGNSSPKSILNRYQTRLNATYPKPLNVQAHTTELFSNMAKSRSLLSLRGEPNPAHPVSEFLNSLDIKGYPKKYIGKML
jgi:hypothetical protein